MNCWPADAFDQFWAMYPKKRNKGDARRAMEKQYKLGTPFELIMAGLKEFNRVKPYSDIQYCPYPASWLNAEAWDNEYEQAQQWTAAERWQQTVSRMRQFQ